METSRTPADDEIKLLTITEAGRLLGIGRTTAYRWASIGRLPVVRHGARGARVPRPALDTFIDEQSERAMEAVRER